MAKLKIKRGDNVIVTTGKNKGSVGEVIQVIIKDGKDPRVVVSGVNIVKKHVKPSAQNPQGGIVEREASLHISNVALVDKAGKPVKVGFKRVEVERNGKKKLRSVRISKATGETL